MMDTQLVIGLGVFVVLLVAVYFIYRKQEAVNPETNPFPPPPVIKTSFYDDYEKPSTDRYEDDGGSLGKPSHKETVMDSKWKKEDDHLRNKR